MPSTHASGVSTSCRNRRIAPARCAGTHASTPPHAADVRGFSRAIHALWTYLQVFSLGFRMLRAAPRLPAPHAGVDAATSTHAGRGSLGLGPPRSRADAPAAGAPSAGCAAAGAAEAEAPGAPSAAAPRVPTSAGSSAAGRGLELPGSAAHLPPAAAGPPSCLAACSSAEAAVCPGASPAEAAVNPAAPFRSVHASGRLGSEWLWQCCAAAPACAVLRTPSCERPCSPGPSGVLPGSPSTGQPEP